MADLLANEGNTTVLELKGDPATVNMGRDLQHWHEEEQVPPNISDPTKSDKA